MVKFELGQAIIVKQGTQDPDLGTDIGGWTGTVCEILEEDGLVLIEWDTKTQAAMSEEAIQTCEEEDLDWTQMYLEVSEIELFKPLLQAEVAQSLITETQEALAQKTNKEPLREKKLSELSEAQEEEAEVA